MSSSSLRPPPRRAIFGYIVPYSGPKSNSAARNHPDFPRIFTLCTQKEADPGGQRPPPGAAGATRMRPLGCADRAAGSKPRRGFDRFADPDPGNHGRISSAMGIEKSKARAVRKPPARVLLYFIPEGRVFGPTDGGLGDWSPRLAHIRLYRPAFLGRSVGLAGRVKVNWHHWPCWLVTQILPPLKVTSTLQICSPRPLPPGFRPRLLSSL